MRLLVLVAAAIVLAHPHPAAPSPVADPICVNAGPLDVMGYEVIPFVQECAPLA